jgi:hypothetical protein
MTYVFNKTRGELLSGTLQPTNLRDNDRNCYLAGDGYRVVRSARTDNADGTYTWAYTVEPVTP